MTLYDDLFAEQEPLLSKLRERDLDEYIYQVQDWREKYFHAIPELSEKELGILWKRMNTIDRLYVDSLEDRREKQKKEWAKEREEQDKKFEAMREEAKKTERKENIIMGSIVATVGGLGLYGAYSLISDILGYFSG